MYFHFQVKDFDFMNGLLHWPKSTFFIGIDTDFMSDDVRSLRGTRSFFRVVIVPISHWVRHRYLDTKISPNIFEYWNKLENFKSILKTFFQPILYGEKIKFEFLLLKIQI